MPFISTRLPLLALRSSLRAPVAARTAAYSGSVRTFSASVAARKSVTDAAKDAAKKVDRTVADAAVKGIETGGVYYFLIAWFWSFSTWSIWLSESALGSETMGYSNCKDPGTSTHDATSLLHYQQTSLARYKNRQHHLHIIHSQNLILVPWLSYCAFIIR